MQIHQLKDPLKSRFMKDVPKPFQQSIEYSQLFPQNESKCDIPLLKQFLKRQGKLSKTLVIRLIQNAGHVFSTYPNNKENQPNLIRLQDPLTISGDVHGQFYDLLKLLSPKTGGDPSQTTYLFLGDYVDRGHYSIQISYPTTFYMLRGNHESRSMTSHFNFRKQCIYKYDQYVYEQFINLFSLLPIAAIVNDKFLCVHGGLSPNMKNLQSIQKLHRFQEIPHQGLFCDLMWADPIDSDTGQMKQLVKNNQKRGCSYYFGYQVCKHIFKPHKILSVIRAHQVQVNGYRMYHWAGTTQFPTVITIFSAPNYCDFYNNKAGVIKLMNNTLDIQQFVQNAHPYHLPNFIDLFEWSIPFVGEKVTQMFKYMMKLNHQFGPDDIVPIQLIKRAQIINAILHMHKKNSQQHIQLVQLNGRTLDQNLIDQPQARQHVHRKSRKQFDNKKKIDHKNQKRPQLDQTKVTQSQQI